jgi:hypothetical protein
MKLLEREVFEDEERMQVAIRLTRNPEGRIVLSDEGVSMMEEKRDEQRVVHSYQLSNHELHANGVVEDETNE